MTPRKLAPIILILIAYAFCYWLLCVPPPSRPYQYDWPGKQLVAKRLAYHGIIGAESDGKGWYFFINKKGQRCRL